MYQLHPSSRLATINRLEIWGCSAPFWGGAAVSPCNTKSPGPRPSSIPSDILIHAAIWSQHIWAENWGRLCPFRGGRAGSPSNTTWPGLRPTCMPSLILIHPTVWPQYSNVTDRQTNKTDSFGRPFVKRFALCYRTFVCPVCLGPSHIVLDGDPAPPKRATASPQFSAHVDCAKKIAHLSCC